MTTQTATQAGELDALVIGAGVAGLYQLHQLRELGLTVHGIEAGADVGGTWHWNRYPGARFDSESYIYQYLFDDDLYRDWTWSERFPAQPEIERWMHYVADRLALRPLISFSTKVTAARWNDTERRWRVETDAGETYAPRYLIGCAGMLSAPLEQRFEGQDSFRGPIFHTARWPRSGVELEGKRVGVIGVGATGIQVIQTIAPVVGALKVFIRTPQYTLPMKNPKFGPDEAKGYKDRLPELKANLPRTFTGFEYDFAHVWAECSPERRREILEEVYADGSLKLWLASFGEMFFETEVSREISDFVAGKIRARLKDPELIELLVPKFEDYGFGTHRVPLEQGYYEAYLRDNVEAIGVRDNPIARIVPEGVELADGTVHELEVIVLAVGFDAGSGALTRIDIRGRNGASLADEWGREIRSTYGMLKHGYPNLFMTAAPLAPSAALCNMTTCLQQQTEWITGCIEHLRQTGHEVIEPTAEAEEAWVAHHDETVAATLFSKTDSWYNGANIEGKPRRFLSYTGGVGAYRQICEDAATGGYQGMEIA